MSTAERVFEPMGPRHTCWAVVQKHRGLAQSARELETCGQRPGMDYLTCRLHRHLESEARQLEALNRRREL